MRHHTLGGAPVEYSNFVLASGVQDCSREDNGQAIGGYKGLKTYIFGMTLHFNGNVSSETKSNCKHTTILLDFIAIYCTCFVIEKYTFSSWDIIQAKERGKKKINCIQIKISFGGHLQRATRNAMTVWQRRISTTLHAKAIFWEHLYKKNVQIESFGIFQ